MGNGIDTQTFYRILDEIYQNRQISRAEPYMLEMLSRAGRLQDIEGIVAVCNELGGLYRAMHRTEDALWAYDKVIDGLDQLGMQNTANYASALINLGNVYIIQKDYRKAYETDLRAMQLLESSKDTYRLASLCNNMSTILREMDLPLDAVRLAGRAIGLIKTMPDHVIDLAISYTNLGQAKAKGKAYEEAREDLLHAIRLFEEKSGDRDTHYAIAVYALANVDFAVGRYQEAAAGFRRAAALIERDFGQNSDYVQVKEDQRRAETCCLGGSGCDVRNR